VVGASTVGVGVATPTAAEHVILQAGQFGQAAQHLAVCSSLCQLPDTAHLFQ
jgi:hypothetical protein